MKEGNLTRHAKQPQGHPMAAPGMSYKKAVADRLRQFRTTTHDSQRPGHRKPPANIDPGGHSPLARQTGYGHASQPKGKSIGVGGENLHRMPSGYTRAVHQSTLLDQHKK